MFRSTVLRQEYLRTPPWRAKNPRPIPEKIPRLRLRLIKRTLRRLNHEANNPKYQPRKRVWKRGDGGWPLVAFDNKSHLMAPRWAPETACGRWIQVTPQFDTLQDGLARNSCPECRWNVEYDSQLRAEQDREKARDRERYKNGKLPYAGHWATDRTMGPR